MIAPTWRGLLSRRAGTRPPLSGAAGPPPAICPAPAQRMHPPNAPHPGAGRCAGVSSMPLRDGHPRIRVGGETVPPDLRGASRAARHAQPSLASIRHSDIAGDNRDAVNLVGLAGPTVVCEEEWDDLP